jgi:hypothetical protein
MKARKSPRNTSSNGPGQASYPVPVYLEFVPGGVEYGSKVSSSSHENWNHLNFVAHDSLIRKALACDKTLHRYAVQAQVHAAVSGNSDPKIAVDKLPIRLPSLSVLAEAAFGCLTGVHSSSVRKWADAMVMAYMKDDEEDESMETIMQMSDEELIESHQSMMESIPKSSPTKSHPGSPVQQSDLVTMLKSIHKEYTSATTDSNEIHHPIRPCGYVFRRGDIAWNCRTCQYDSTCVLCDKCFHNSDHEGHDVYFHRTSPGGCCDCGDTEAWKSEGCCPLHRPKNVKVDSKIDDDIAKSIGENLDDDVFEAFKASIRGRADGELYVQNSLSPKLAAALGVVIGAAIQTIVNAADGSGIGADIVQWKRRWADQIRKITDGRAFDEEYALSTQSSSAATITEAISLPFPARFNLHLRLHNDDVHTYDEVIEAMYSGPRFPPRSFSADEKTNETDTSHGLVNDIEEATTLTHGVDQDGQVLVKRYETMEGAIAGFNRLKEKGLHCSVVSTPQLELETRARILLTWLSDISEAHPAVSALIVHGLVDVTEGKDLFGGATVWTHSKIIPPWSFSQDYLSSRLTSSDENNNTDKNVFGWRLRFDVFLPHLESSYLTREEFRQLHTLGFSTVSDLSSSKKGADFDFYSNVPYILPNERYRKSPHSLWGIMPSPFTAPKKYVHPVLFRGGANHEDSYHLMDRLIVLDTDLRKHQEADTLITNRFTHQLLGLYMISGVGLVDVDGDEDGGSMMKPTADEWKQLLSVSSYRSPVSPLLLLLLLDPYPTKQLRVTIHQLFLSLLIDSRMRSKFAASLGGIAYRPLTTLFCAGVGTENDTPLTFTVQIFTAGSIVRALCNLKASQKLLCNDSLCYQNDDSGVRDVFCLPLAHNIARCVHSNILGACKEVRMALKNTSSTNWNDSSNSSLLKDLVFEAGEPPLSTLLPAAPDDGFLDRRSIKHKRMSHLLRDLEYVLETPGTAMRLLVPLGDEIPTTVHFASVWSRLLRLGQGIDPQKRKTGGGHVEYEQLRWLEAFSLSLHFSGARDNLAESLPNCSPGSPSPKLKNIQDAIGNLFVSLLREIKWWLYREGILSTVTPANSRLLADGQLEVLQRSTLHVSSTTIRNAGVTMEKRTKTPALSCATQTKMTESHLNIIESAMRIEESQHRLSGSGRGAIMGDWLRVPHSPHAGDSFSFHLPLHRSFARNIRSFCALSVPEDLRTESPFTWWQIPVLDDVSGNAVGDMFDHPLCTLLRPTLRSANCKITWTSGPECTSEEAKSRRARSKAISAAIASAKVIHSLCDHPLRCLAAADQISRHLWARNGASAGGMALNYGTAPLCKSFRDLDMTLVQLSAAGFSVGLGARRVFSMILSRFALEGFLCDLERKSTNMSPTHSEQSKPSEMWVLPRRLQDMDHCQVLMEGFFSSLCVIVTELPPPPDFFPNENCSMKKLIRRELLHALATQNLSYSKAMEAASIAVSRKDEHATSSEGDATFKTVFEAVLNEISLKKSQASKAPMYQLKADVSDEYDPSFYHLKRSDHQHAMDNIANLRKQKLSKTNDTGPCFPIVIPPPPAHPRFLPARLILHLPALDAAIRRSLIFVLTGGKWIPPSGPDDDISLLEVPSASSDIADHSRGVRSYSRRKVTQDDTEKPFSAQTIKDSSISFLEVLQLLTLQVHTLEECALLHQTHLQLDFENKSTASSISIYSYLCRLIHVPAGVTDTWAFLPYPDGPLKSQGSGMNKASILGLLIALYEHRAEHGSSNTKEEGRNDEDHGGARYLADDGLKWLLRFVSSIVDGAESISEACKSATEGFHVRNKAQFHGSSWLIEDSLVETVRGMLANLPHLWPMEEKVISKNIDEQTEKSREARKAAQMRILEQMKKQQESFAATIQDENTNNCSAVKEESELCIICRCDDEDGESNGPLGYLGHVQRSRTLQLRSQIECIEPAHPIVTSYRVVGDKGCQIRKSISLDSAPIACIPSGCIVEAVNCESEQHFDLQTRRILVRYKSATNTVEGWASVRSSQGYVILSPLVNICYNNTRWGSTRPFIRQCGHAAHLGCVETHVASIHQKSQTDTPYDGRFAADIEDGEFLCPLCKQLCNVVIPSEAVNQFKTKVTSIADKSVSLGVDILSEQISRIRQLLVSTNYIQGNDKAAANAIKQYGNYLQHSMQVFSWDPQQKRKKRFQEGWHKAIRNWDFKEDENDQLFSQVPGSSLDPLISDILRLLRQQHIAWAATGYTAASAEASSRGIKRQGFDPNTDDPWAEFNEDSKDSNPALLELRRTMVAASSLYKVLCREIHDKLGPQSKESQIPSIVGSLLSNILNGGFWSVDPQLNQPSFDEWNVLSAFLASNPCHVSKDETLSLRQEARATASQIWAIKGLSPLFNPDEKNLSTSLPPPPLCIRHAEGKEKLQAHWGTLNPCNAFDNSLLPFRPAIASAFLYIPLLSWDLTTFSGAIFSALLACDTVNSYDMVNAAKILLVARMVQALVAFDYSNTKNDNSSWTSDSDINQDKEEKSIVDLFNYCQSKLGRPDFKQFEYRDGDQLGLLGHISSSILPLSRSLVLLLRASMSYLRQHGNHISNDVDSFLENDETMYIEDGLHFLQNLGCPLPSDLILDSNDSRNNENGTWISLIDRWIDAAVSLDTYQGSQGSHLDFNIDTKTFVPKEVIHDQPIVNDRPSVQAMVEATDEGMEVGMDFFEHFHDEAMDEDSDDSMEDDDDGDEDSDDAIPLNNDNIMIRFGEINAVDSALDINADESDDEEMEDVEGDGDLDFDYGIEVVTHDPPNLEVQNDESSHGVKQYSWDTEAVAASDQYYANVSSSAIIPYQPSFFGHKAPGPGPRGGVLDFKKAANIMKDLSHLSLIHRPIGSYQGSGLIRLPKSFVELYSLVNRLKNGGQSKSIDDGDENSGGETAICLVTGAIIRAGTSRRTYNRRSRSPGSCTLHARNVGSGTGIFFLLQKCTVLLVHNKKSAYSSSIYVDANGEEDQGLARGRPLFLKEERYAALADLWRQHRIPGEVSQIRSTSDRVIRDSWY